MPLTKRRLNETDSPLGHMLIVLGAGDDINYITFDADHRDENVAHREEVTEPIGMLRHGQSGGN